jgi:hypothetical protein
METYVVQKKILAIHSEDRDVTKWPTPTQFELDLAVDYKNVVGMRLNEIELPVPLYVFSAQDQNTKLTVSVSGNDPVVVEISAGHYTPDQMVAELTGRLNAATGTTFVIIYDVVTRKLTVTNTVPFNLYFFCGEEYNSCNQPYFDQYSKWGLGSYLGFQKQDYVATMGNVHVYSQGVALLGVFSVTAPNILDVAGDTCLYMELATYNNIDELMPYQERTSDLYYGKFGGKHNSSFAKIPIRDRSSREDYLSNIFFSEPPLERIQKLRFKMRYHDGRPVHFHGMDFNFTIELTTLRNESAKKFVVNRNNYYLT